MRAACLCRARDTAKAAIAGIFLHAPDMDILRASSSSWTAMDSRISFSVISPVIDPPPGKAETKRVWQSVAEVRDAVRR